MSRNRNRNGRQKADKEENEEIIRHDSWTEERQDRFFAHLEMTSNVQESAKLAGMGRSSAYRMRDRNAAFRMRWEKALAEGYAHLEMETLHRARFGSERVTIETDANGTVTKRTVAKVMDGRYSLAVMAHHRATMAAHRAVDAELIGQADAETERTTRKGLATLRRLLGDRGTRDGSDAAPDAG